MYNKTLNNNKNKTNKTINMTTTTLSVDIQKHLAKHERGLDCALDAQRSCEYGLTLNKITLLKSAGDPEVIKMCDEMNEIGEKRLADCVNKVKFHRLMIMLFNTFVAITNGRSDVSVLTKVVDKLKDAIQTLLSGIEELVAFGEDFYTEEEYINISNALMKEYNAWSPICNSEHTFEIHTC